MLPFLKSKKDSPSPGVIVKTRAPDQPDASEDQDDPSAAHEACGQAILQAIQDNDAAGIASAIQDLMEIGSAPEAEPHSFDAQNQSATQGIE